MLEAACRGHRLSQLIRSFLLATLLVAGRAFAESDGDAERLVLLIAERADDPFIERVHAELVTSGFVVQRRPNDTSLEQAARDSHAVAAVRVLPTRLGVEVWMADRTSGRSLLRQVIVDESAGGPDQGLIALQTAELLRTSLLSAAAPTQASSAEPAPASSAPSPPAPSSSGAATASSADPTSLRPSQPELPAAAKPSAPAELEPTAGLQAALGALYSPGGSASALQLWVSLERSLTPRMALALDLSAPLRSGSLSGPEGSAQIGTYLAGAAFLIQGQSKNRVFYYNAGLGIAAARIALDSDANAPLVGNSRSVVTGASYLRSDVTLALAPWLRLGARATLGAALARVQIHFAGNDAGSWGRPFAGAFFLAEIPWR